MDMEIQKDGKKLDIKLAGRLDTKTSPELKEALKNSLSDVEELTFDLSGLHYISSSGLRIILSAQKRMNKQGSMKVVNVQYKSTVFNTRVEKNLNSDRTVET